jgi:type IV pilus assembly protein PilB
MAVTIEEFKEQLNNSIINADVVKIFDNLLTIAVESEASDVHIEAFEDYCRMRLRIDGELIELVQYPKSLHESIISKFKIESGQMRPDEKRLPQDARVSTMTLTNKEIDLRASTLPTVWWEKLVMRIVDKSKKTPKLDDLGIEGSNREIILRQLESPNGIILTTWPTGSGKTATLYAALNYVNTIDVNITTFEDPVENKMHGLNQSQVRADIGFTFWSGLRAALRQDPDIIMVWEIRDSETLEMAMEAAMTWHLVFSTIHTNSSAETITRVFNLWALPYMVAGTFNVVMAQRLIRRICTECKHTISIKDTPQRKDAVDSFRGLDQNVLKNEIMSRDITAEQWKVFITDGSMHSWSWVDTNGQKCAHCNGTWFKWRIWVYEMMEYSDEIRNQLVGWKTAYEIENYALWKGMINLERDGVLKVIKWYTALEEIYRIVKHKKIIG